MKREGSIKTLCYKLALLLPDKWFSILKYYKNFHCFPNLKKPRTFNEKITWLKLHYHNLYYTSLVDKYEVKKIVADMIGEQYVIPTLGVWDKAQDIDFDTLPDQFVLKATHDSGRVIICRDKSKLNIDEVRKEMDYSLKRDFYAITRERPYKNIKRRIIAEEFIQDDSNDELKDYKIFNFDGNPQIIQVDLNRFTNHKRNIYTTDWSLIEAEIQYPSDREHIVAKPGGLQKMLDFAHILSRGMPHVRTDFYCIGDKVYFGEMTFYHGSGIEKFRPEKFGRDLGDLIKLPEVFS